jgi:hypothetical protein
MAALEEERINDCITVSEAECIEERETFLAFVYHVLAL